MGLLYVYLWNIPTEIETVCVLLVHKTQAAWTGTSQIQTLVWTELSNSLHNSEVMVRVLCGRLLTPPAPHTPFLSLLVERVEIPAS
jgi:hypothetical protein